MKEVKVDDRKLINALKLGKRCFALVDQSESELSVSPTNSKYRQAGGRRKVAVPEVRKALYDWFIDVRGTLKARLPKSMFKTQATLLYDQWFAQQPEAPKADERSLNPIQDGHFRGCSRMGGGAKRPPLLKICHTYPTMMKLGTVRS